MNIADRLSLQLGYDKIYDVTCPFILWNKFQLKEKQISLKNVLVNMLWLTKKKCNL